MDGGPPGIQSIAARAAGCGLRGLLAQRCGLLSFPGDGSEAACALDPQSIRVWGGRWLPACGWVCRLAALGFGCCPCQKLWFPSFTPANRPWAGRQPPGRGSKRQRWQPRVSTCAVLARCAQTKQPRRVPRAAVLGSSRTDKAPSRPRDALRAPAAWHRVPSCRSKEHHHPATACVTYHMEDGGWRACRGGRLEDACWRAGRPCFESNACFVLH